MKFTNKRKYEFNKLNYEMNIPVEQHDLFKKRLGFDPNKSIYKNGLITAPNILDFGTCYLHQSYILQGTLSNFRNKSCRFLIHKDKQMKNDDMTFELKLKYKPGLIATGIDKIYQLELILKNEGNINTQLYIKIKSQICKPIKAYGIKNPNSKDTVHQQSRAEFYKKVITYQ